MTLELERQGVLALYKVILGTSSVFIPTPLWVDQFQTEGLEKMERNGCEKNRSADQKGRYALQIKGLERKYPFWYKVDRKKEH